MNTDHPEIAADVLKHVGQVTRHHVNPYAPLERCPTYMTGRAFARYCIGKGYPMHIVDQEMAEERVYWRVLRGFDAVLEEETAKRDAPDSVATEPTTGELPSAV